MHEYQQCWAYIDNPIWDPYPINISDCGRIIRPCQSDINCSYNGVCNSNTGNCTCNPGWYGYTCNSINLQPGRLGTGYNYTNSSYNTSSWGGSIQYDSKSGVYRMFVAEMVNNCGINSWQTNSQIVVAESENNYNNNYISNYKRIKRLMVPFAHSPDIIYASNTNEYVLLYVHNRSSNDVPPCDICIDGSTPDGCKHQNVTETTALRYISADNFDNAWDIKQWSDPIQLYNTENGDSNFAAQIDDNGTLIGMMRVPGKPKVLYLVTAENWKDNNTYILHRNQNNKAGVFPYLPLSGLEDMYLWKDCDGRWHSLFHNGVPGMKHNQLLCGSHAYSKDGLNWIFGGKAYSNTVVFNVSVGDDDGSGSAMGGGIGWQLKNVTYTRRERPHLVFDLNDGCTPVALTNAVEFVKDKSFTLIQPIKH